MRDQQWGKYIQQAQARRIKHKALGFDDRLQKNLSHGHTELIIIILEAFKVEHDYL